MRDVSGATVLFTVLLMCLQITVKYDAGGLYAVGLRMVFFIEQLVADLIVKCILYNPSLECRHISPDFFQ